MPSVTSVHPAPQTIEIGTFQTPQIQIGEVTDDGVYVYGVIIAAPVIGVLMLLDTGIAVMGRTMPQMNVYFLFLPLKIGAALILTAASLRYLSPVLERLFLTVFEYWQRLLMSGAT